MQKWIARDSLSCAMLDPGKILLNYGVIGLLFAPSEGEGGIAAPGPEWVTWRVLSILALIGGIFFLYMYRWHLKSNDLWPTSEIPG